MSEAASPAVGRRFRRQFLLGPRAPEGLDGWPRWRVGARHLASHPDLPVHQAACGDTQLTLLGYVVDPGRPDAGDREILEGWAARADAGEAPADLVHPVAGRFALVVCGPRGDSILQDAAGFRTVVHTVGRSEGTWCATDTPLLAEQLGLEEDPRQRKLWIRASYRTIPWLPLRETLHRGTRALIPNHALDLGDETQHRFWPVRRREPRDPDAVVEEAADWIRRIVTAGHRRFPLALGVTAGIDSRVVLAACREFREEVLYFTFCRHREREADREDVQIPAQMLGRFGLPHHVFHCDRPDDPELAADFVASVSNPSEHRLDQVRDLDHYLAPDCVRLSGHFGETARSMFSARVDRSPRSLARRFYKGTVPAAIPVIRPWFEEARATAERFDYTVRDLHYWESRAGRWAASSQNQYDLARET
ncbi:MAG TPA: hypothetical protein VKB65_13745, partial [Myxococcota bacterium]|nr:hypothetical protein [Myxococcota bacterium]